MIQDIYPHKLYNQYDPEAKVTQEDTILNIFNGKLLVQLEKFQNNELVFPKRNEMKADCKLEEVSGASDEKIRKAEQEVCNINPSYTYLFTVDEEKYYLLPGELADEDIPSGYGYVEERSLRKEGIGPAERLFAAITGKHLSDWYRDTQFCGRCGQKMVHSAKERAMTCEACHYTAYPRIMPAVIVGVINGEKLLLTKYKTSYGHNALIAGFTEIGETMEETVTREVMEEAGIRVKNIRYYKSQPWGSANDILLGYYCEVDGDDAITMDSEELKYAEWVQREEIILQPGTFSLTNEMMKRFKDGLE